MAPIVCTRPRPPFPAGLAIGTLNTWGGKGFGLTQAIQEVEHGGFDVMLLIETKIQVEEYSQNRMGFDVIFSAALPYSASGSQGGVGLVLRDRTNGWGIKSTLFHGLNLVICNIITGRIRTPLVGA